MYKHNRENANEIANTIWQQKRLYKIPGCEEIRNYPLTDKQQTLVQDAVRAFQELYLDLLSLYDANNSQGLSQKIQSMFANYIAINRHQNIIGNNSTEAESGTRGLYLIYRLWKEENTIAVAEKKTTVQNEMNPLVLFFGRNIDTAINLFNEYVIGIAIRFQNAIMMISKQDIMGLQNFAKYLAYMTIQKCRNKLNERHLSILDTNEKKIAFMTEQLVTFTAANALWENKNLKTERDHVLNIDRLLLHSSIGAPPEKDDNKNLWDNADKDKVNTKIKTFLDYFWCCDRSIDKMPHQLCSSDELEFSKVRYKQHENY